MFECASTNSTAFKSKVTDPLVLGRRMASNKVAASTNPSSEFIEHLVTMAAVAFAACSSSNCDRGGTTTLPMV